MNAADVLTTAHEGWARQSDGPPWADLGKWLVAALLAHGEQGVAILPDGTMWALEEVGTVDRPSPTDTYWSIGNHRIKHPTRYLSEDVDYIDDAPLDAEADDRWADPAYRLVPLSAEAGDTDGPIPNVPSTWMGGGLEITYGSAEAGDTDA
jgi:hypothetical protein